MSSDIQCREEPQTVGIGESNLPTHLGDFNSDDDDIFCDFDTLPVTGFSDVSHLWRNAKRTSLDEELKSVFPTAYDLRDDELESRQISLYEAINQLKVPENLELEAYNVNFFLSTQAPLDISSCIILKLDVYRLMRAAETSAMVGEFIESVSKTEAQNESHVNAFHWDVTFTTSDHDRLVHIKSLLCECSTIFPDVKNMTPADYSKKMAKVRKSRAKVKNEASKLLLKKDEQ